ncbi:MAG: hypothetical protein RML32_03125 [Gammaproteobacteria bacterium]|nr:hypothetical protein [Gammaproteobacteria bacterium]
MTDNEQKWREKIHAALGGEWTDAITAVNFRDGHLTIGVASAALAARVRLALTSALLAQSLGLPGGLPPRSVRVRVVPRESVR